MKTAKRKVTQRRSASKASDPATPLPVPAPVSATLSAKTSQLVRWYCAITRHRDNDAVEGAVCGALERAKDAYEGTPGGDEAFNWLLDDVLKGMYDDARHPLALRAAYGGGFTVRLNVEASALLSRYLDQNGDDPRDVVSGAVESMLRCVLEDGEVGFPEAMQLAERQRLAEESEKERQNVAMAAFYESRKGVVA